MGSQENHEQDQTTFTNTRDSTENIKRKPKEKQTNKTKQNENEYKQAWDGAKSGQRVKKNESRNRDRNGINWTSSS